MKKLIEKSEIILNEDVKVWENILRKIEFPKDRYNLGAEYCEMHLNAENLANSDISIFQSEKLDISTLGLALNILSQINIDKFEEIYLTDELSDEKTFSYTIKKYCENCTKIFCGEDTDLFEYCSDHIDDIIKDMNIYLENDDNLFLNIGILVRRIMLISEKQFDSRLVVVCQYE